jgi:transcriptional regulator with XRE-family HTH domain
MKKPAKSILWDQSAFASRLRFILKVRNMTQAQLAHAVGVAQATVSRWQSSRSNYPSLDSLNFIAHVVKVSPCWLTYGSAEHAPPEVHDLIDAVKTRWPHDYLENESS